MAYCTIPDILKVLPETQVIRLTDDEDTGHYNTDRVQEAIDDAGKEIDSYLGSRIALPITGTVPSILQKFNEDITVYNLYSRKVEEMPETRKERYQAAVRLLEKIAEGKLTLGLQPPPDPPAAQSCENAAQVQSRPKIFDETVMNKY